MDTQIKNRTGLPLGYVHVYVHGVTGALFRDFYELYRPGLRSKKGDRIHIG
jgi:hypothetical protein